MTGNPACRSQTTAWQRDVDASFVTSPHYAAGETLFGSPRVPHPSYLALSLRVLD